MKYRKMHHVLVLTVLVSASACKDGAEPIDEGPGLMGTTIFFPYPSVHLMEEDAESATGWKLNIPADILPVAEEGTPMPVDRFNRLDGFSPATPIHVYFEGVEIDEGSIPLQGRIAESVEATSSVQIIDLETGDRHPLMVDLDSQEAAIEQHKRSLIIRPMKVLKWAHHYAVILTKDLKTVSGESVPVPRKFAALVKGSGIPDDLKDYKDHYNELFEKLEDLYIDKNNLVLAWDFWTGSKEVTLAQINHIMEGTRADLPADPDFEPEYSVMESRYMDSDINDDVPENIWRHVELYFKLETYVNEEGTFELDEEGLPKAQGKGEFVLLIHLPPSIHDAPAGSVPVMVFGHGLLGMPHDDLVMEGDQSGALYSSDRYGMIFAAAEWRGLSYRDDLDAVGAAKDFGTFNRVTEDLHMGVANFAAVGRMFKTKFIEAEFLRTADGSGSLVDTDRIYFMGISLGGHQGGVTMAVSDVFQYGVLQVGGCPWTTLLERSANWLQYTVIINSWVRDPLERQMLYAVSQMLWDPVDPATHYEALRDKSILLQESIGDAGVPNISTEFWARSIGLPLVQPSPTHPPFIEEVDAPVGPGGSALFMYDGMHYTECGRMPPETNLPAEDNCAHGIIRSSEAHHQQIEAFFEKDNEGTIIHPPDCGDDPCRPRR